MEVYNHQSIGQRAADLQLRLTTHSDDSIEFELVNMRYSQQRLHKVKQLLALICLYGAWSSISASGATRVWLQRITLTDFAFLLWLLQNITSTFNLVKREKLLFCLDFALQLQTERFCSRLSNIFISTADIHDVVINEVIEDLDIHYILVVRTKGSLFKQKPIIPIFNTLLPSVDCLEMIYKRLNKIINKSAENS